MKPPGRTPLFDIRSATTILLLLACLALPAWGQSDEDEIPAPRAEVALVHQSATVRLYEFKDVMDFLIVEAIDHFKAAGVKEVSLGNAPLANVLATDGEKLESREERAVKFLFDNFDKFYGYKSLFNFKKKYLPDWQGRYLAYRPRVSLAMVGLAIAGVHLPRGFVGLVRS